MLTRREAVLAAPMAVAAPAFAAGPGLVTEADWAAVVAQYDLPRGVIQLENGNWGKMARPVQATYLRMVERVNRDTSFYARRDMATDMAAVRERIAQAMGADLDELVITRNATEALKALIGGYNRLRPGDAVLYGDLDYDSMQAACDTLARRSGGSVVRIALPEPATFDGLIETYRAALDANPRVRLMLLTHLSHRTGLVIPVREIVAMARARGVDCIVDAAHSWGQLDFKLTDLGADFIGVNLHKWIGAPLGVGAAYIRRGRASAIDADASEPADSDGAQARVHTGTADFAAQLTVPAALDFQHAIGGPAREARLRALRDRWVNGVRGLSAIEVLTPADPRLHGAITSFRLKGRTSSPQNVALVEALLARHRIFTVARAGPAKGACVRVTPALFNTMADVDRLVEALRDVARSA